ncbi:Ribulose-phosphate 3-epimerase [Candidatus Kinetoplastibacterium sorsogonicusi]|uniref:Ribulose-phosphate 3-epimerase n=1 Tax=Candidatus Kinetoplastidibacterium kentomonadis TaxID=1576550 RepID=A0A3Q8ETU9_9PROT|nr:ribulose-phosphate 3-epimerase [Candidatus Kinetoplastibacterium sorsogonicusi]AWD32188.1 Ribulose-phosphate 3-epimerase [Candidatus Kinetoplastibacterium sorsogonicusi]
MSNIKIAPSILSANFTCLGKEIEEVTKSGADWIHFDVMDNHYVPNLSFGPIICKAVRKSTSIPLDVHIMANNIDALIPQFADAGADIISFHCETTPHLDRTISLIHKYGCKAGLAFNPSTPLHYLDHVLSNLDLILIMSVNPGFANQQFLESSLIKIKLVRKIIDDHIKNSGKNIFLEVDGGIKTDNIAKIKIAGADICVAGSAIFHAENYSQAINALKTKATINTN